MPTHQLTTATREPSHLLLVSPLVSSVLTAHQPQRSLCSVDQNLLSVPCCNSSFGQRSFSYCAPKIWNDIPLSVRQSPSLDSFKRNLKTHYFANNWPPGDCVRSLWFDILDIVRSTNCYIHIFILPSGSKQIIKQLNHNVNVSESTGISNH